MGVLSDWKSRVATQQQRNLSIRKYGKAPTELPDQWVGFDIDGVPVDKLTTPRSVWSRESKVNHLVVNETEGKFITVNQVTVGHNVVNEDGSDDKYVVKAEDSDIQPAQKSIKSSVDNARPEGIAKDWPSRVALQRQQLILSDHSKGP
jgi:hypothetical protein